MMCTMIEDRTIRTIDKRLDGNEKIARSRTMNCRKLWLRIMKHDSMADGPHN